MTIRHLDTFAGIGGFSLAAQMVGGIEPAGFVEIDPWCRRVLAKHWPGVPQHDDIKSATEFARGLGRIDLITGGYPCQPFSLAGQRKGADDDRHLWPFLRRVIDEARPRYVLAENVTGHISMGLDTVLAEMESDGYTVRAVVIPACAVNALHRRDRIWIMAYANDGGATERGQRADAPGEGAARGNDRGGGDINPWEIAVRGAGQDTGAGAVADAGFIGKGEQDTQGYALGDGGKAWETSFSRSDDTANAEVLADADDDRGESAWRGEGVSAELPEPDVQGLAGAVPDTDGEGLEGGWIRGSTPERGQGTGSVPDTERIGQQGSWQSRDTIGSAEDGQRETGDALNGDYRPEGHEAPRRVDAGTDGFSAGLVRGFATRSAWADGSWEADLPRVIREEKDRTPKLKAAGNAIVPQVAYELLRVMLAGETA